MQKTLTELLHDLEHEMLRLGYTKKSMNFSAIPQIGFS